MQKEKYPFLRKNLLLHKQLIRFMIILSGKKRNKAKKRKCRMLSTRKIKKILFILSNVGKNTWQNIH